MSKAPRSRVPFNSDWSFCRGDGPSGTPAEANVSREVTERLYYAQVRDAILPTADYLLGDVERHRRLKERKLATAVTPNFARVDYDASTWQNVTLPHDYAILGPFSPELPGETGKLPWSGVAWYRKRFNVASVGSEERVILHVDGAMSYSTFWLNGKLIGGWPYGYTSFQLDLSPHLNPDGENVLCVRLDNPESSSRFYPGAGLYRNLWLSRIHAVHVAPNGLFVHTPSVTAKAAVIQVDLTLCNELSTEVCVKLETTVFERMADSEQPLTPASTTLHFEEVSCHIPAHGTTQQTVCATLENPKLWSLEARHRYSVKTTLFVGETPVDEVVEHFGVRRIEFDPNRGFFLNGKHTRIQGVCMHHDLGALGSAVSIRALERQIEILQAMGCNSIRTSHNPPAPELLELCDEMGILLMVEAFDCWRRGKKSPEGLKEGDPGFCYFDYARVFDDWHEPDLRAMIRTSRNHPSVFVYSIGNEVIEQWHADGWTLATALAGIAREEDRTRPITAGCNGEIAAYRGFQTALDLFGFNYKPKAYGELHRRNPTLCMIGTETASTISTRGEYFFPVTDDKSQGQVNFQVSSYDLSAPPWAFPPDDEFQGLDEAPYVAGEYVWTGFDYLGEPTPYNSDSTNLLNYSDVEEKEKHRLELEQLGKITVPSRSSYFGIIDLAGFPKDRFYLYQARWRPELPMAHILPHWNWPERMGQVTPVHVYSSADEAELYLNGRSLGTRRRGPFEYRFRWDDVTYEPGELRVVTRKNGALWAEARRKTVGSAVRLSATSDRDTLRADGLDLAFITVSVFDADDQVVPRSSPSIECQVEGAAELIAMDNGDPTSHVPFQSSTRAAHHGLLLAILRTKADTHGSIEVTVSATGLIPARLTLRSVPRT